MLKNKNIAFLGAGSMAEAMISGIVDSKKVPLSQITVSNHHNKEQLKTLKKKYNIQAVSQEQLQIVQHDIIILAMKPKDAEDAIQSIAPLLQSDQLILSVIAGLQTSFIERLLPSGQQPAARGRRRSRTPAAGRAGQPRRRAARPSRRSAADPPAPGSTARHPSGKA